MPRKRNRSVYVEKPHVKTLEDVLKIKRDQLRLINLEEYDLMCANAQKESLREPTSKETSVMKNHRIRIKNRISAKESRIRRKEHLQTLQNTIQQLKTELDVMKTQVFQERAEKNSLLYWKTHVFQQCGHCSHMTSDEKVDSITENNKKMDDELLSALKYATEIESLKESCKQNSKFITEIRKDISDIKEDINQIGLTYNEIMEMQVDDLQVKVKSLEELLHSQLDIFEEMSFRSETTGIAFFDMCMERYEKRVKKVDNRLFDTTKISGAMEELDKRIKKTIQKIPQKQVPVPTTTTMTETCFINPNNLWIITPPSEENVVSLLDDGENSLNNL